MITHNELFELNEIITMDLFCVKVQKIYKKQFALRTVCFDPSTLTNSYYYMYGFLGNTLIENQMLKIQNLYSKLFRHKLT